MTSEPEILLTTRRFRVERRTQILPDGVVHQREVIIHPGAVAILPQLADGRLCLIRNYRLAVQETLIELPAGTLDPGEEPAETATRELQEETGYRAGKIEKLCELLMSPGILNERMFIFVATNLQPGETALETGEQIEPVLATLEEAIAMVRSGKIQDAKSVAALLYYERFRQPA